MKSTENAIDLQVIERECESRIDAFFKHFKVPTLARNSRITKVKGHSVSSILLTIFILPFIGKNIYRKIVLDPEAEIGKDAIYNFMRSSTYSWRRFLLALSFRAYEFIDTLTSNERESVLIVDDSTISKNRAKKIELLAKIHDHTTGRYLKGFKLLSLAWSDGSTLLPIDFILRSSTKKKSRYQEANKKIDQRTCGGRRRKEAITKSTDLVEPMIERALKAGIEAKYLLMDSWFAMPVLIDKLYKHIHVICMAKRTKKIHYIFEEQELDIVKIYKKIRKRRGRAKILANAQVMTKNGTALKIVFVRNRHKKDWLAILSTDTSLPDKDIIRIYGKRWDIEVFFRTAKQHLELEKGCQSRDFDALIAHTTMVMVRYIFLSIEKRRTEDPRSLGLLFHRCCEEIQDSTLAQALSKILGITLEKLNKTDDLLGNIEKILIDAFQEGVRNFASRLDQIFNEKSGLPGAS